MKTRLFGAGLLLAVCSGAAYGEGRLNFYNWSDYIAEDTLETFTETTGITVNYDVFDSNEVAEAKLLAGNSGYDLMVLTSDFLRRNIDVGAFAKLDKSKIPNLRNLDEKMQADAAIHDPGNAYGVIYTWGTTGLGYDVGQVEERLGHNFPKDSWALLFEHEYVSKLADCGVTMLDDASEMLPAALNYLGFDPNTDDEEPMKAALDLLKNIRPFVRYFHNSQYISDLANGDICLTVGWSGDVFQAQARADEAENGVEIVYVIPQEGASEWLDMLVIPADAPHPDSAHAFIDFFLTPQISADLTNYVWFASANTAAMPLIDPEVRENPGIFPDQETLAKLWPNKARSPENQRRLTRRWTSLKLGF